MVHLDIFLLGVVIMAITIAAVVLVCLQEAGDPEHSRLEDLSDWEKKLVDRPDIDERETAA